MIVLGRIPPSPAVSRRAFLGAAAAAAGLMLDPRLSHAGGDQPSRPDGLQRPFLRVPPMTSNGARVPVAVEVAHSMEPGHHVAALEVVNARDPVPLKGRFHFSPANGRAFVAFQARLDEGPSAIVARAECGRHGQSTASAPVTVAEGGGGCIGAAPPTVRTGSDEIRPPVIRIPRLIADGHIGAGEIVAVQVKTKHPSRTGLVARGGRFVQESEPFHLQEMEVFYDREPVSRFVLSAALSDNPLISFTLRVRPGGIVRVSLTNTRGQRFEAAHRIPLS